MVEGVDEGVEERRGEGRGARGYESNVVVTKVVQREHLSSMAARSLKKGLRTNLLRDSVSPRPSWPA